MAASFFSQTSVAVDVCRNQERKGQLWRYFGAIAGVKIPDGVGLAVFFVVLTISLWTVGLLGITGTVLWQTALVFGCLGAIIGCRL